MFRVYRTTAGKLSHIRTGTIGRMVARQIGTVRAPSRMFAREITTVRQHDWNPLVDNVILRLSITHGF